MTSYYLLELGINNIGLLGSELISRPYLTLGILSWFILLALAVTSFQRMQRKLGKRWQTLHNLIYLVAIHGTCPLSLVSQNPFAATHYLCAFSSGPVSLALQKVH